MFMSVSLLDAEDAECSSGRGSSRTKGFRRWQGGVMLLVAGGRQVARHLREMGKTMLEKKLHPDHTGPHTTQ